jgi:hypothetical protein
MGDVDITRQVADWLASRLPADWFEEDPQVLVDRDEIVIVGPLACSVPTGADSPELAEKGRIVDFRAESRDQRIALAAEAEALFDRKVSWVAGCGHTTLPFTTLSLPVMTRLGFEERRVLDTLVAAGVAGSRSEALAWCVRTAGEDQAEWLAELRDALAAVEKVRAQGQP